MFGDDVVRLRRQRHGLHLDYAADTNMAEMGDEPLRAFAQRMHHDCGLRQRTGVTPPTSRGQLATSEARMAASRRSTPASLNHVLRDPKLAQSAPAAGTIQHRARREGGGAVVGSVKDLADQLEQWCVERACDGFVVAATHLPGAFEDFVRLVIPNCNAAACITAIMGASPCAKTSASACRSRVGGSSRRGIFCRQPGCFCNREATDRAPADSTLSGRGKPNRSRRVFSS